MKPDLQRIAIAEICGWRKGSANVNPDHSKADGFWFEGRFYIGTSHLPDYPNSLDAMHEAEKVLTTKQTAEYFYKLRGLVGSAAGKLQGLVVHPADDYLYHVAASQRAEAFLKVFKLWID